MKKEWILQTVVLLLFYLDSIIFIAHDQVEWSESAGFDFILSIFHALLFFIVCYFLIPKFFYPKQYLYFFLSLLFAIFVFAIVEEEVLEKIFSPNIRGTNDFSWKSIYFFLGETIVPLLSFVTIKFVFDNLEQQRKVEKIEKDNLENELKFLKSQIQPHILFNSLNNLYDFTLSKSDKAPELVLGLSNVLRYVLYETKDEKVKLSKELDFIKDYISLQEMQLEGRGEIDFQIKENARTEKLKISPFLLIPFIENSFKHSLQTKEDGILIEIKIEVTEQALILEVKNNFEKQNHSSVDLLTKGIGLDNVKKRLAILYPNQHHLEIQVKENWYHVQLNLKLESWKS